MREEGSKPQLPAWTLNPRRWIFWRACLCGAAGAQMLLLVRGGWTVRHSLSFPLFIAAVIVLHPLMGRKLPIFRLDLVRSWRLYVGAVLLAAINLIEIGSL
jgi:hypothetical protein